MQIYKCVILLNIFNYSINPYIFVVFSKDVVADIREIGRNIEGNPDILAVVERIESEYKELKEESRFIIFVKTRATAIALSERLPDYLRSTYLTGSHKSVEEGGNYHLFHQTNQLFL